MLYKCFAFAGMANEDSIHIIYATIWIDNYSWPFKFSTTWGCVSLPRSTTSSGWKWSLYAYYCIFTNTCVLFCFRLSHRAVISVMWWRQRTEMYCRRDLLSSSTATGRYLKKAHHSVLKSNQRWLDVDNISACVFTCLSPHVSCWTPNKFSAKMQAFYAFAA